MRSSSTTETLPPYLARLDEKQRAAALDTQGYVAIHACAGAGKTAVLAARAAYLLDNGVPPNKILCLTFTNKAADEMRNRIEGYSGRDLSAMWMGTYHSVCARILRVYGSAVGIQPDFGICDDGESTHILRKAVRKIGISWRDRETSQLKTYLDQYKSQLIEMVDWFGNLSQTTSEVSIHRFEQLYSTYQSHLRSRNTLDFNDLTRETLRLLTSSSETTRTLSSRFEYILVDEYQDTSRVEADILRRLSLHHHNLCVVGDIKQSIYSFKGSDYRLMMEFEKTHPGARGHVLNTNYRSARRIVDTAEQVICGSEKANHRCEPARSCDGEVAYLSFPSDVDEANTIANIIRDMVATHTVTYRDIAVLSRIRSISHRLEQELARFDIPYIAHKPTVSNSPEAQCSIAYLRLIVDPEDMAARELLARFADGPDLENGLTAAVERLRGMHTCGVAVSGVMEAVIDQVIADLNLRRQDRWITAFQELRKLTPSDLGYSLSAMQLILDSFCCDIDAGAHEDCVRVMTIHQSKGLEFPVVFVIGMDENILPARQALTDPEALEEERRLCYVAMTRSTECLCLSSCTTRHLARERAFRKSRFVSGIICEHPSGLLAYDRGIRLKPAP